MASSKSTKPSNVWDMNCSRWGLGGNREDLPPWDKFLPSYDNIERGKKKMLELNWESCEVFSDCSAKILAVKLRNVDLKRFTFLPWPVLLSGIAH